MTALSTWPAVEAFLSRVSSTTAIRLITHDDAEWLLLEARLCPARMLRPRCAMIAMTDLPMGAICVAGDTAVFRHTLPLATLTEASLETTLRVFDEIAHELVDAQGFVEVDDPSVPLDYNDARFAFIYW